MIRGAAHRGNRFIRPLVRALGLILAIACSHGAHAEDRPLATASATTRIIYGIDADFAPFEWIDDDGAPHGFQVDMIRALAERLGVELEFRAGIWPKVKLEFLAGDIDVVSMVELADRREYADFSIPHSTNAGEIFIRRGTPPISNLSELAGKTVIVEKDAAAAELLRQEGIAARLIEVNSQGEALTLLSMGRGDYAMASQANGRYQMKRLKLSNLTTSGPPYLQTSNAFAVRKGNTAMLELLNRGIEQLKADGTYSALYERWFGTSGHRSVSLRKVLIIGASIVGPLVAAFVASLVWSRSLRQQVKARTTDLERELSIRRAAEHALHESNERFRVALAASSILVANQDRDLKYTWVYDPKGLIPQNRPVGMTDEALWPPDIANRLLEIKKRVLARGQGEHDEFTIDCSRGRRIFDVVVEPLPGENGTVEGLTTAALDITDVKQAESQRIELERKLRDAQKLQSLGLMAAGVAHDYDNLLFSVRANAEVLKNAAGADPRAAASVALIEEASNQAADLTRQLMAYAAQSPPTRNEVDLAALTRETTDLFRSSLRPSIKLQVDLEPGARPITGNATQVRQVLLNLLQNASDALEGESGEIRVRVSTRHVNRGEILTAEVGADAPEGEYTSLEVSDTGPGIDPEIRAKMFDPFFTTKRRAQGSGMGLAIVLAAVRQHRGVIKVSSQVGKGSTFEVLWPGL